MKKTLTAAALSSLMVLGLATSALAIHATDTAEQPMVVKGNTKVTVDGSVRERGFYDKANAVENRNGNTGYDSRVQLGVNAQVSDQASGYVRLESGAGSGDTDQWGNGGAAGLHTGGTKLGALTILEAWVNYNPGAWGVKVGHMPLALGNKVFFDHTGSGDDAIVFYSNLGDATHVAALTIKFDEQTLGDHTNDLDGYVALITHKVSDSLNLGANWTYLRGGDERPGSLAALGIMANGDLFTAPTGNFYGDTGYELAAGMSMSNIGLTADGKIGAIDYMADLEFQFGDVANYDMAGNTLTVDANGWAAKLGANYDLGAGKIGILLGYGSGDDDTDVNKDLADGDNSLDHDAYINFLTDTSYDTIIAGYRAAIPGANSYAGTAGITAANGRNTGLSNLTLIQLKGSTKVVCPLTGKDLSLLATASYMKLTEDMINGTQSDGSANEVDNVGTELDLVATWALTAGLNYKVEAAYMWTGDVYEVETLGNSTNPDDLAFIRHSLDLKF